MFARLFPGYRQKEQGYKLYGKLVGQARNPVFYTEFGVPDDMDGRFDMILLHMFVLDHRLAGEAVGTKKIRRFVQEALFSDMDRSLREMGVGDMSIGKEVKKMGAAWFGRVKAYTAAIKSDSPLKELSIAVAKNLYKSEDAPHAEAIAGYMLESLQKLKSVPQPDVVASNFEFPDIHLPAKGK